MPNVLRKVKTAAITRSVKVNMLKPVISLGTSGYDKANIVNEFQNA